MITNRQKVIDFLRQHKDAPGLDKYFTCAEISDVIEVKEATLSSVLNKMAFNEEINKVPDIGPNGGFGYCYRGK